MMNNEGDSFLTQTTMTPELKKFRDGMYIFLATQGVVILFTFIFVAGGIKETMSQNSSRITALEQEKAEKEVIAESLKSINLTLMDIKIGLNRVENKVDQHIQINP